MPTSKNTPDENQFNVEPIAHEGEEEITWDSLVTIYTAARENLVTAIGMLELLDNTFGAIIDGDEEISTTFNGSTKAIHDLSQELVGILGQHSKIVTEGEQTTHYPFTGAVNKKDPKHTELYLMLIVAYDGINDKIKSVSDVTQTTLTGLIYPAAKAAENAAPQAPTAEPVPTEEDTDAK